MTTTTRPAPRRSADHTTRADVTPRLAARIAGIGYVALFALAIFANFTVFEGLVVDGDAATTTANITASSGLFRLGVLAFLVVFLIDIVVAWALHVLFRDHDHDLSLLTAWSRLAYTVFLGVALVFAVQVLHLVDGAGTTGAFSPAQVEAQVMTALQAFDSTWLVGLAAFGLHLVLLGRLVLSHGAAPRVLGVLLMAAGIAYAADTTAHILLPDYDAVADVMIAVVAIPSVIAEGWLALWLLRRATRSATA